MDVSRTCALVRSILAKLIYRSFRVNVAYKETRESEKLMFFAGFFSSLIAGLPVGLLTGLLACLLALTLACLLACLLASSLACQLFGMLSCLLAGWLACCYVAGKKQIIKVSPFVVKLL